MRDPEHARIMLAMARKDLKALKGMEDPETFASEIFGFHAEQAVQKALKGWLSLAGVAYPKIHDLEELLRLLEDHQQTIPPDFRGLVDLADFAVQFRYDSFEDLGHDLDRQKVRDQVAKLVDHVEALLREAEGKA